MGSGGLNSATWGADENWRDEVGAEGVEEEEAMGGAALGIAEVRDEDAALPANL